MFRVIDCFMFYNELDLLTYRLNILDNIVDYFVIVEATHTHSGMEKKLFYNDNKHLFDKFNHKIIHIIVEDFPHKYPNVNIENRDVWKNEHFHRDSISRGINMINDLSDSDIIIIADLDEIPDPNTLDKIKKGEIEVDFNSLQMDLYYYNLNSRLGIWQELKIITYRKYKELNVSPNSIRCNYGNYISTIPKGGWHLSYFGDKYFIQNKIKHAAHQEFNSPEFTDLSKIEERLKNNKDLYDRNYINRLEIKDNHYLPVDYDKYLTKYYN